MVVATVRFRGFVDSASHGSFTTIALRQEDGYKQDLVSRIIEAAENYGEKVAVRYWTATSPQADEAIEAGSIRQIAGWINAEFEANEYSYSEYTSGVDYDTIFKVGGHNLYDELRSHDGKWLLLEVKFLKE